MLTNFNDLFDEFFNRKRSDPKMINDDISKIIQSLSNIKQTKEEEMLEKSVQENLGEPDEVTKRIEDGLMFTKMVWNTNHGQFVNIIVSDAPKDNIKYSTQSQKKEKSIEERLNEAVEAEDYDLAIKLRDEINAKTTPIKKTRKKTKE